MAKAFWNAFSAEAGLVGIPLEQDFAAGPVELRFECAVAEAISHRQRFIEDRYGAIAIARPRFDIRHRDREQRVEIQEALLAQAFDAAAHLGEPLAKRTKFSRRQAFEKLPIRSPHRQIVLTRETGRHGTVLRGARPVASHQLEQGRVYFRIRMRADMRHACKPLLRAVNERYRAPDVSQRP